MVSQTLTYRATPGRFDELYDEGGAIRPAWKPVFGDVERQGEHGLAERRRLIGQLLAAEGAGHAVQDGETEPNMLPSHPWMVDPLPYMLEAVEWRALAAGVDQRVRMFEAMLGDVYGSRNLLRRGVVPTEVVYGTPRYRWPLVAASAHGVTSLGMPMTRVALYACDLARLADGTWRVVADYTDTPQGIGYAMINRSVIARVLGGELARSGAATQSGFLGAMRASFSALAAPERPTMRTVLVTPGIEDGAYVEQSYLATLLGFNLVENSDVVVRNNRAWLRTFGGLEAADTLVRWSADRAADPVAGDATGRGGVPGLARAHLHGSVGLANALGNGIAEEAALREFHPAICSELLGEQLQLHSLAADASTDSVKLASTPISFASGLRTGTIVLRLFATQAEGKVTVMTSGIARVLRPGDRLMKPSALLAKDVWVVGDVGRAAITTTKRQRLAQVDLLASLPTRSADALYWLGRHAERAELLARSHRVVASREPTLRSFPADAADLTAHAFVGLLRRARTEMPAAPTDAAGSTADLIDDELARAAAAIDDRLSNLSAEAATVREFMSGTTGRVLIRLRNYLSERAETGTVTDDDLDELLVDLAAMSGMAMESTVRGPSWRFLDLGRRLERSFGVLDSIEAAVVPVVPNVAESMLAEAVLATHDSLVAYRRRYRSDVEIDAVVALLVSDDSNPRALQFQLDRMSEHLASLGWSDGTQLIDRVARAIFDWSDVTIDRVTRRRASLERLVADARAALVELGTGIQVRWFSDPIAPQPLARLQSLGNDSSSSVVRN